MCSQSNECASSVYTYISPLHVLPTNEAVSSHTWATTSEMDAEPTMTLYLCLRRIPACIHAWRDIKTHTQKNTDKYRLQYAVYPLFHCCKQNMEIRLICLSFCNWSVSDFCTVRIVLFKIIDYEQDLHMDHTYLGLIHNVCQSWFHVANFDTKITLK